MYTPTNDPFTKPVFLFPVSTFLEMEESDIVASGRQHLGELVNLVNDFLQVVNFMNHQNPQLGSTFFVHLINYEL
jgi:hypothetical protein